MALRRFVILAVVLALTFTTGMAVQAGEGKGGLPAIGWVNS